MGLSLGRIETGLKNRMPSGMRPAGGCIPYGMQGMGNLHFLPSEPFSTGRTIFYRANHFLPSEPFSTERTIPIGMVKKPAF